MKKIVALWHLLLDIIFDRTNPFDNRSSAAGSFHDDLVRQLPLEFKPDAIAKRLSTSNPGGNAHDRRKARRFDESIVQATSYERRASEKEK